MAPSSGSSTSIANSPSAVNLVITIENGIATNKNSSNTGRQILYRKGYEFRNYGTGNADGDGYSTICLYKASPLRNPVFLGCAIIGGGIGAFMIKQYINTPAGRKQYDQLKLSLPVFGLLNKKVAISRSCRTLGTLLSSGVPIMQALEIVGKASGNEIIASTVTRIRDSIREGESIASPLGASGMFPLGEETGNLDAMLGKISDFYDTEVEYLLSSLTSMLEPIMIVGMGGIVGFIVIAVFLPLYQLIGSMG